MNLLPQSLIDLTWLRVVNRLHPHTAIVQRRSTHATAIAFKVHSEMQDGTLGTIFAEDSQTSKNESMDRSLYSRLKRPNEGLMATTASASLNFRIDGEREDMLKLESKADWLKSLTGVEETSLLDGYNATLSESDLLDVFQDLLDVTPTTSSGTSPSLVSSKQDSEEDDALVRNLAQRSLGRTDEGVPASELDPPVKSKAETSSHHDTASSGPQLSGALQSVHKPYHAVLLRLAAIIKTSTSVKVDEDLVSTSECSSDLLPTSSEWTSLIRVCLREVEYECAEQALTMMKECHVPAKQVNEEVTRVLEFHARNGNVAKTESILSNFIIDHPDPTQRHLHIKAHLKSTPVKTIPLNALSLLHQYENQNLAPPMKTYGSLMGSLFSIPSSIAKAQAWDLFSHMRYVSHPDPDVFIYTLMIRACASAPASGGVNVSEPERALDLWTEMTVDKMMSPTRDAYNAVILACARSGDKRYVNEAFRLAREMLDGHRDSRGHGAFRPNGDLFMALLDGAKRLGDLGRVRWILAEMVKAILDHRSDCDGYETEVDNVKLDDRIMIHVFHAYASYKVPFKREQTLLVKEAETEQDVSEVSVDVQEPADTDAVESDPGVPFSSLPPQSQSGVIGEVKNLFDTIVEDNRVVEDFSVTDDVPRIFKQVRITAPLLNSYLSVYYSHARFSTSREIYGSVFQDFGVEKDVYSYVEALEMCTCVNKGTREHALRFAQDIWSDWERFIETPRSPPKSDTILPRLLERAHIALIRIYALNGQLDLALEHLKAFAHKYPPKSLSKPATNTKPPIRSTRTVLKTGHSTTVAPRPLVRLTSATDVTDDTVPPFVSFSDLELLHHRLVAANRLKDIKYIKWICTSYSGALRNRRDRTLTQGVAS